MNVNASLHETHISIVFLVGDRAYKLKKPVHFPFIDLSTAELREEACHREVELNRRLAPDVYLGVASVSAPDGSGCDHLVVMRRMDDERRLSTLVTQGRASDADMVELARLIASFHSWADRSSTIAAAGRLGSMWRRWDAGFDEIAPFVGPVLDPGLETEIEHLVREYLAGRKHLFQSRIDAGRIVDGHGDLLADDVFLLPDGPRALDCLEFDDRLRYGDVLADTAFLAMDLERLGAEPLAARFLSAYRELSGETHPRSLEDHYIAFRAHIRAKVACLRGGPTGAAEARSLLDIAHRHLRRARVRLVLVGGDPGAGKSTLAAGIGARTGWVVLRSDEVRKDLAGVGHTDRLTSGFGTGSYGAAATDATYAELLERARRLLADGESVILDATWHDERQRLDAAALAWDTSSALVELRGDAPAEIREARVAQRAQRDCDASDASVEVARALAATANPWPTATTVDTATELDSERWTWVMNLLDGGTPAEPLEADGAA